jgi:hypothetical protein
MNPASRVLDVGCGCLRIGAPLIDLLNKNCYTGVEPCVSVLHAGVVHELAQGLVAEKNPVFLYTPVFDFTPLKGGFTHVLASDLFIHCSASQLKLFLTNLKTVISADTKVLMTVNVSETEFALAKEKLANTPEEKAAQNKFLYEHADNNTTVHSEEGLAALIAEAGYGHMTRNVFPMPCGKYSKHVKVLALLR